MKEGLSSQGKDFIIDKTESISNGENEVFKEKKESFYQFLEKFYSSDEFGSDLIYEVYEKTGVVLNFEDYKRKSFSQEKIKVVFSFLEEEDFLEDGALTGNENEGTGLDNSNSIGDGSGDNKDFEVKENDESNMVKIDIQAFAESKEGEGGGEDGDVLTQMTIFESNILPLIEALPSSDEPGYEKAMQGFLQKLSRPEYGMIDSDEKIENEDIPYIFEDFIDLMENFDEESRVKRAKIRRKVEMLKKAKNILEKKIAGGEKNKDLESGIENVLDKHKKTLSEILENKTKFTFKYYNNKEMTLDEIISNLEKKAHNDDILTKKEAEDYKRVRSLIKEETKKWEVRLQENYISSIKPESFLSNLKDEVKELANKVDRRNGEIDLLVRDLEIKGGSLEEFANKSLKEMLVVFQNGRVNFSRTEAEKYLKLFFAQADKEIKKIPEQKIPKKNNESEEEYQERKEKERKKKQLEMKILVQGFFSLIDSGLISKECINSTNLMVIKKSFLQTSAKSADAGELSNMEKNKLFNFAVLDGHRLVEEELIEKKDSLENLEIEKIYTSDKCGATYEKNEGSWDKINQFLEVDSVENCTLDIYRKYYQKKSEVYDKKGKKQEGWKDKEIYEFDFIDSSSMPIVQRIVYGISQELMKEKSSGNDSINSIFSKYSAHIKSDSVGMEGLVREICSSDYMVDRFGRSIKLDIAKELETFGDDAKDIIVYMAQMKASRDNLKSEANFNLMGRLGTSIQYNPAEKGDDGVASHFFEILNQKIANKNDRDEFLLMSRYIDLSDYREGTLNKKVPPLKIGDQYREIVKEDFDSDNKKKDERTKLKKQLNQLIQEKLDLIKKKDKGESIDENNLTLIKNEIKKILRQIDENQTCNPGYLAIENLDMVDEVMHSRYRAMDIKKYKVERGKAFTTLSQLANQTKDNFNGDDYLGGEGAYIDIMKNTIGVVASTPKSRNYKEWNEFLQEKPGEDGKNFHSIIYKAGAIKSFVVDNEKNRHIWEQMGASISYMIFGILESIPGSTVKLEGKIGGIFKGFEARKESEDYENFVVDIAATMLNIIKDSSDNTVIPPALIKDVKEKLNNIVERGYYFKKIINKRTSYVEKEKEYFELNKYRVKRDPAFAREVKRASSWNFEDVKIMRRSPLARDIANFGSTIR